MILRPKVSVIIPTYNCVQYLPEAIESVLKQTCRDFEIIIVDDGSTDNTKEIVGKYLKDYPNKIKYLYQENRGLACARNAGIKHSNGEYIALLDADDIWLQNRLEDEITIMDEDPLIGLVHANVQMISESAELLYVPVRNTEKLTGNIFNELFLRKTHVACPTVLIRRKCLDDVGLFDERLTRLGCEDRDLWLRIARCCKISYIDKVLAYYRIRRTSMSRDYKKMFKARMYVVNKYCSNGKNRLLKRMAAAQIYREMGSDILRSFVKNIF